MIIIHLFTGSNISISDTLLSLQDGIHILCPILANLFEFQVQATSLIDTFILEYYNEQTIH